MSQEERVVLYERETPPAEGLRYTQIPAPDAIASCVRSLWHLQGEAGRDDEPQPVVPDGCVELVFNLADPFHRMTQPGIFERQPAHLLVGQMTQAAMLRPSGRIDLWGVRLRPWVVATLFGIPGSVLRDRIVPIDALDDATAAMAEWLPRLAEAPHASRERLLLAMLTERVRLVRAEEPVVAHLVRQILVAPDTLTVGSLAAGVGLSARRVQSLFAEHVGLAPKLLYRIARFQRALSLSRERPQLSWAGIALAAGYHDQSHFIRDCREFASCSPSRLRASDHDLTDSFLSA